ncbi:MAG: hypothetical protein ABSH52_13010 [Terriglobia bacterium]|jgi:hypothetical protein
MKNLTRIALIALVGAVLVSTVACHTTSKASATPVTPAEAPIPITSTSARNPWAGTCTLAYSGSNDEATCTITVPSTEEIVIQTVSGQLLRPSPSQLSTKVSTTSGGSTALWNTLPTPVTTAAGADDYIWSSPVTLYADPGSSIVITVTNISGTLGSVPAGNGVTLVGYYVTSSSS